MRAVGLSGSAVHTCANAAADAGVNIKQRFTVYITSYFVIV